MFYEFIIIVLFIYAVVISILYFIDLNNRDNFQKERLDQITKKEEELKHRESAVIDKELKFNSKSESESFS